MDRLTFAKRFATAAAAGVALLAASAAQARSEVYLSIGVPAAPVYVQPTPVYVQPRPVYTHPRPVYVQPQPVYVQPQPIYAPGYHDRGHRRGWDGHDRRAHRWGPHGDLDRDGIANRYDRDRDGDGIRNRHDRVPNDRYRY